MSALKSLKFTNFNVDNFSAFLANASISKGNHSIDVSPKLVCCKAAPVDMRYIKYSAVNGVDILQFDNFPSGASSIVLKFVAFKKLTQAMGIYAMSKTNLITGEIFYHVSDGGICICDYIKFKSGKINMNVRCDDDAMVPYLTDAQWSKYSNREDVAIKFDLDSDALKQLQSLIEMDKQNAILLSAEKSKLVFKSKNDTDEEGVWDLLHEGNYINNGTDELTVYNVSKMILESVTNKNMYTVYICRNKDAAGNEKLSVVYYHDENNIIISTANKNG